MIKIPIAKFEINPTELCNRKCSFCPRAFDYPNLNLHMTAETAEEIIRQSKHMTNTYTIAGRGEPLLCNNIVEILEVLMLYKVKFNFTTNGDHLEKFFDVLDPIMNLQSKTNMYNFQVNCYDGYEQKIERQEKWYKYKALDITCTREDVPDGERYKDRMKRGKFTNRAGFLPWTYKNNTSLPCYILFRKCFVDWNGDVQLCCHDWKEMRSFGNIHEKPFQEIWEGKEMMDYRIKLAKENGRQSFNVCSQCDAAQEWKEQEADYNKWKVNQV